MLSRKAEVNNKFQENLQAANKENCVLDANAIQAGDNNK
jgi:hypothetical protein